MKYKFQLKTGNISEGSNTIFVKDGIAEVEAEDLTPAMQLLIKAHGGQLVRSEPERRSTKKKAVSDGGS